MNISELEEPYKSLAKKRRDFEGNYKEGEERPTTLLSAFTWGQTPEGHEFWVKVNGGGKPEIKTKPEKIRKVSPEGEHKREMSKRRDKRIKTLRDCKTPEELALNIWSIGLEKAMGSSKEVYRKPFVDWIECYKTEEIPTWKYKTPMDLAEGIWQPYLDSESDNGLFVALRKELVKWIEKYKS